MNRFIRIALCIGLLAVFSGSLAHAQFFFMEHELTDKAAPVFALPTLKDESVSLDAYRAGEKAIIFFWATWCPHCREALKELNAKRAEIEGENVNSLEFQTNEFGESLDKIQPLLSKLGQPSDKFKDIKDAVGWLNGSVEPFKMYADHIKANPNQIVVGLLPPDFQTLLEHQLKELATTPDGYKLKRTILTQLYPQEAPAKHGIKIIVVDVGETKAVVEKYIVRQKIELDIFLDEESKVSASYALVGVPTLFFVNEEGIVKNVKHSLPENYQKLFE